VIMMLRVILLFALSTLGTQIWSYTFFPNYNHDVKGYFCVAHNIDSVNQKCSYDDRQNFFKPVNALQVDVGEEKSVDRLLFALLGDFLATKRGTADFIVSRDGAVVPNSPTATRQSLENAGFGGKKISNPSGTETGTIHNIPGMKMDVRVMNGGPVHPSRVVTTRQGTRQPVNPANGSNFGNVPKAEQRARSHIPFQ